jgi:autotransporter passenger strand-loop-strand repeat protein
MGDENRSDLDAIGRVVSKTTVSQGETRRVSSGGTALFTTVNSRGWQAVSSGGTAVSATVNWGGIPDCRKRRYGSLYNIRLGEGVVRQ